MGGRAMMTDLSKGPQGLVGKLPRAYGLASRFQRTLLYDFPYRTWTNLVPYLDGDNVEATLFARWDSLESTRELCHAT